MLTVHARWIRRILVALALSTLAGSAYAESVTLAWDASPESDIAGYIVYVGSAPGVYSSSVDVGRVTTWTVTGLTAGQRYYFAARSYDTSGLQSALSNETSTIVSPAASPADVTAPTPGSTLTSSTAAFQWSAGVGVSSYQLSVGTALGGSNLFTQAANANLTATVTGLPTNGSTIYVRLSSLIGGVWQYRDYTYKTVTAAAGQITAPTPGSTLTSSSAVFQWSAGVGVSSYQLSVGTAPGGANLFTQTGSTRTATVTGLPTNGSTIYVRLGSLIGATWQTFDYSYIALTTGGTLPQPTLTPASTTVTAGTTISVTLANGPGSRTDWVGLFPSAAADVNGWLAWQYLNGSMTPPVGGVTGATLSFTAPMTPGPYNVRLFSNNSWVKLATSATITVPAPTVTPTSTTVVAGATISVTVANGPGSATDWVGLFPSAATDVNGWLAWQYLNGSMTPPGSGESGATLSFTAPMTAGTYNVRLFSSNSWVKLATSVTITVPAPTVTPTPTTVSAGATFTISVANGPGTATDWIGLFPSAAADVNGWLAWQYLNSSMTPPVGGVTGATLSFTAPMTPGTYNVRLFSSNSYTKLATSAAITVVPPPPPTLTPALTTVTTGATISVTVANGPGNAGDWVGLYPTTAADAGYVAWQYLNGLTSTPASGATSATVRFVAPTTPGTYDVRLFANNSWTRVATSATITVIPPPVLPTDACPCSIWDASATPGAHIPDPNAIEVGVKFRADTAGYITGVRFYKYAQNTGTHTGHLWTASGTLLGSVTFTSETASGWQQATFAAPIPIAANTTYVASYFAPAGNYAGTAPGFAAGVDNPPLHALADSTSGGNGVRRYGATSGFPNQTWNAANYWVDVVFTTP